MAEQQDFLVEIGTEELPPRALADLSRAFAEETTRRLDAAELEHGEVRRFATPRRLALIVEQLAVRQPDQARERRGPPAKVAFDADGKPTRAGEKFAESCGVALGEIERIETPKGAWLMHRYVEPGHEVATLLPGFVSEALAALPIPKRMRWGAGEAEFVRPVHWVVMLLGEDTVEATILGQPAGNISRGHRFHAPGRLVIDRPGAYVAALETHGYVVADFAVRRELIRVGVIGAASELGGTPRLDEALVDEVAALVEWPVPLAGRFDERFLELPPEVLVATLQDHQRYFPVENETGALLPGFVTVSNIESRMPAQVRAGNERVVRPRLADAAFFWDTDRKRTLASRVAELGRVVFEKKLGTVRAKSERVAALAALVAARLGADAEKAQRAAQLAKADLLTDMVGEFPNLQGTMGRYYAAHDGEDPEVAQAIEEQYLPRFAGDGLPATTTGRIVALVEKIDTLAGIFAIGGRPTGSRDPFGLRRGALGVLRILVECRLDLDLEALIGDALAQVPVEVDVEAMRSELFEYCLDRLRAYYLDDPKLGIDAGMFDAVLARRPLRPLDFDERLRAVEAFSRLDAAASLAAANKRIANILRQAGEAVPENPSEDRLVEPAEQVLYARLQTLRGEVEPLLADRQYQAALEKLASLREDVDLFFDEVMVMADDEALRTNRLALLGQLRALFLHTADISRLQA